MRKSPPPRLEPHAADWQGAHAFPRELLDKLAKLGLLGVCVPEEHGGAGADFLSYILVLEELSRADERAGVTDAVHRSARTLPILAFGTGDQVVGFVPALARGETIGCFALTKPGRRGRRRLARHVGGGGGWPLAHPRLEAVDHERGVRRPVVLRSRAPTRALAPRGVCQRSSSTARRSR